MQFHYVPMTPGTVLSIIAWPDCAEYFDIIEVRIDAERIAFPFTEPASFRLHQRIDFRVRNRTHAAHRFFGSMVIARADRLMTQTRAERIEEKAAVLMAVWDRFIELGHKPEVSPADMDVLRYALELDIPESRETPSRPDRACTHEGSTDLAEYRWCGICGALGVLMTDGSYTWESPHPKRTV